MEDYIKDKIVEYGKLNGYVSEEDYYKGYDFKFLNLNQYTFYNTFDSPSDAIRYCFPNYIFLEWKFKKCKSGWWQNIKNQKQYLKWFEELKGIKSPEDWYNITYQNIKDNYGAQILSFFSNSPKKIAKFLYPEFEFKFWKFRCSSMNDWSNLNNQKEYLKWFEELKGIKSPEDWYNITSKDIINCNGATLITNNYNNSVYNVVNFLYPDYNFINWKFKNIPKNYWSKDENKIKFLKWFEELKGIKSPEDWYNVSLNDFLDNNAYSLLRKFEKIYNVAKFLYPDFNFEQDKFYSNTKTQGLIYQYVKEILEEDNLDYDVHYNYKWDVTYDNSNRKIELDIFIPELKLAIEYNGEQHYHLHEHFHRSEDVFLKQQERDIEKKRKCKEYNIKLYVIKYDEEITKEKIVKIFE